MNTAADFRTAFESRGYQRLANPPTASSLTHWYRLQDSTDEAIQVAVLQYKPTWEAFSVHVGVCNRYAMNLLNDAIPVIRRFLHPALAEGRGSFLNNPCWTLFDAGRALGWKLLLIPDPDERENWRAEFQRLFDNFLAPVLWPVQSPKAIQDLLFRTEKPFDWMVSNSVIRIAEIIALGKVSDADPKALRARIVGLGQNIQKDVCGSSDVEGMMDELVNRIYATTRQ